MRVKDSTVDLTDLNPDMKVAMDVLDEVYRSLGMTEVTITSGRDGVHMSQSKHYSGEAVDARVVDVLDMIATKVKARLESLRPRTFDTALELTPTRCPNCGKSLKGSHIHVEHDPK